MSECGKNAKILTENILYSLKQTPAQWKLIKGEMAATRTGLELESKSIEVLIEPRRFRIFDRLTVEFKGRDIWLPRSSRLRIRKRVREVLAYKATADF